MKQCDVLVVGAGPAGSGTAMAAAKNGLSTLLIEEDAVIGKPVQCAEGIGSYLLPRLPFTVPKEMLRWSIAGMYFWTDDIAMLCDKNDYFCGYTVDRSQWDPWLASHAVENGAQLMLESKLVSLEYDGDTVIKAVVDHKGKTVEIQPTYVVGADGAHSTVVDSLNVPKRDVLGYVKSYEMKHLKLKYPHYDHMLFGSFAPRAYGYIFPFSTTEANFGVGTIYKEKNLDEMFEEFLNIPFIKKQTKNAEKVVEKSGEVPIRDICEKPVYGNVYLVGDTANHNIKPFIEGNIPGILCGNILGDFLLKVSRGEEQPENYGNILYEQFPDIKDSEPITDIVYGEHEFPDDQFNLIILGIMSELFSPDELEKYVAMSYDELRSFILENGGHIEK